MAKQFILLFILLLFSPSPVFSADNLLLNPDFEQTSVASFPNWSKKPTSTLILSVASISGLTHNGSFAAGLKSQTNSTKYLYQVIASPSGSYKLSAWLRLLTTNQTGFVRLSWHSTPDGSGTAFDSVDSPIVTTANDWQRVDVVGNTPTAAGSLQTRLVLHPNSSETAELLFDEVTLEAVDSAPSLTFIISLPGDVNTGEQFDLSVELTGLSAGSKYSLKVLGGEKIKLPGELFNFYTWSPSKSAFLAWNATWSDFPSLTADSLGAATIQVKGKFKSDSSLGENKIIIRLRKEGTDTNIDSDAAAINLNQPEASALVDDGKKEPAIPGPFLSSTTILLTRELVEDELLQASESSATEDGQVLGSEFPEFPPLSLINPAAKTDDQKPVASNDFPWEVPLLSLGGLFLGGSILTMIIKGGGWSFVKGIFLRV